MNTLLKSCSKGIHFNEIKHFMSEGARKYSVRSKHAHRKDLTSRSVERSEHNACNGFEFTVNNKA